MRMSSRSVALTLLAAFAQLFLSIRGQRTWIVNGTSKKTREPIVPIWYWLFPFLPMSYLTVIFASQLLQVAKGLQYLHSVGIVHGTLKAVSFFFFFFCLLQSTSGQLMFGAFLF